MIFVKYLFIFGWKVFSFLICGNSDDSFFGKNFDINLLWILREY